MYIICNTDVIPKSKNVIPLMNIPQIKFVFDRKNRATDTRKGTIDMRITYNRKKKFIATGVRCYPGHWSDKDESLIKGKAMDADEANAILIKLRKRILSIIGSMIDRDSIDINAIPMLIRQDSVDISFIDYIYKRIKAKKVTDHTVKSYNTMLNKLEEYGKIRFFSDITQKNIRDFSEWLHGYSVKSTDRFGNEVGRNYSQATIYKITSNLSLFISDAVVDGYVKENPYVSKRMGEKKGNTRIDQYLTTDEVAAIENAEMPTRSLDEARDLFLLQCYTGLAYIDLMTFDFTKYKNVDEDELCTGKRHKTGVEFHFVLTEASRKILGKYGFMIPKLPNQKYNVKLKLVADAAKIDKPITSHMGRRTAGSVWLNSGIPVEIVSKCLGHSSIAMTQRAYAKILDKTIVDAFRKLKESET